MKKEQTTDWGMGEDIVDYFGPQPVSEKEFRTGKPDKDPKEEEEEEEEEEEDDINEDDFDLNRDEDENDEKPKKRKPKKVQAEKGEKDEDDEEEIEEEEEEEEEGADGEENEEEEEGSDAVSEGYKAFVADLKYRNIIPADTPDDVEPEKVYELYEAELDRRVDEELTSFAEDLDDDGKSFLKFKRDGGRTSDFMPVFTQKSPQDFTNSVEKVKYFLVKHDGYDDEAADLMIQTAQDADTFTKMEGNVDKRWTAMIEKQKKTLIDTQAAAKESKVKEAQQFRSVLIEKVSNPEFRKKWGLSEDDVSKLPSFLSLQTAKVGNNPITPFLASIVEILNNSPEELLVLGKIVQSKFDLSFLERKIETDIVTGKRGSSLAALRGKGGNKTTPKRRGGSQIRKGRGVWDQIG